MKKMIILSISILLLVTSSISFVEGQYIVNQRNIQKNDLINENSENIYDFLIITPQKFSKYVQPLVDHKNKYGVKTISVNLQNVYEQTFWQGRDNAEKVKYFIKNSIENWGIKYVLLFGGVKGQSNEQWWIPVRYSNLERGYLRESGELLAENKFLSDLYFADIYDSEGNFSSWDTNNNMKFSEWPIGESAVDLPDLIPDVAVGRLTCRNVLEVIFTVRKIINYETDQKPDSWFKKMVVIAGDTYPDKSDYIDGEVYTQIGMNMMPGFEYIKIWSSNGKLTDWKSIYPDFNKGCGFIWFSGHGGPGIWSTHPVNDNKTWIGKFANIHTLLLRNKEKLPVCIAGSGCFVSMFNISITNPVHIWKINLFPNLFPNLCIRASYTTNCWSETQVKKPNGGTIATIGSTGYSYETPDLNIGFGGCEQLDIAFFEQYGQNNVEILGDAWAGAVTTFLQNNTIDWEDTNFDGFAMLVKNAQQWLLIGDPSLKIGGYKQE